MGTGDEGASDSLSDAVLWEMVEEHLDELEFCFSQHQRAHSNPLLRLAELSRGMEARLLRHLDGLAVEGPEVCLELSRRVADEISPNWPQKASAIALMLTSIGIGEAASPLLGHKDRRVRLATASGCSLAASDRLDGAAAAHLAGAKGPGEKGAWLELMGRRDQQPSNLAALLASAEAEVVAGALRCLRRPVPSLAVAVERLAEHEDPLVRERALRVALAWRTGRALAICESQALDSAQLSPVAMAAYAMLAGPAQRARLEQSAGSEERAPHVLRALGLSGALDMVAPLLERLGAKSALEAKVAVQAVVAITGLDLRRDEFAGPEAPEPPDSLPPLEEDDLDADLVPKPEEELPSPNAGAIHAWWASRKAALHPGQRHVLGVPRTPESLFEALESGPLGLREGWATALHFWSGGALWLDCEALTAVQRARVSQARGTVAQWPRRNLGAAY